MTAIARRQYMRVWYLPKISFLKLCAVFLMEMLSLHLAQHVWPAMFFSLDFPKPGFSILLWNVTEHMFHSWTCPCQCAVWDCAREQADRAHDKARIWWGKESYWLISGGLVHKPYPGRWLQNSSQWSYELLLSCVGSYLHWVHPAGTTLVWHTDGLSVWYTFKWRESSSAKQSNCINRIDLSNHPSAVREPVSC